MGLRSFGHGWGAVCYGRALHLPPSALTPREYPPAHAIVAELRPFRRRLHRQRAAVIAVRALGLAIMCAVIVLIVRITGVAVPLPLAPSIAAGIGLFIGVGVIIAQRPSTAQLAQALDQRLGLHEQIGSALDLDPTEGRLAALLHERAGTSLRNANHEYVLPWPSLRRERFWLICLGVLVAVSALIAVHAPLARPALPVAASSAAAARHGVTLNRRTAVGSGALKLVALGAGARARLLNGAHNQSGNHGATRTHNGATTGRGSGHSQSANGLQLRTGQARGGARTSGPGTRTAAPSNGSGKTGVAARTGAQGSGLHLTAGKNSATGGVLSPAQQALQNLQSSISSAQSPPPGSNYVNAPNNRGSSSPRESQGQRRTGAGRQGAGHRNAQGQGRSGGRRGNGQGAAQSGNGASPENTSRGPNQPFGLRGNNGENARFGRRAGGQGVDGNNPYGASPNNGSGSARLSDNQGITLNGAAGKGGRMILTVGAPNRAPGLGGASYGASTNAAITVPGYVAPDSNTVSPDDRALIRQYFSPSSN